VRPKQDKEVQPLAVHIGMDVHCRKTVYVALEMRGGIQLILGREIPPRSPRRVFDLRRVSFVPSPVLPRLRDRRTGGLCACMSDIGNTCLEDGCIGACFYLKATFASYRL